MKKNVLLILFAFFTQFSNAQCSLTFDDLEKSAYYSLSDFETFALKKGFSYNSDKDAYVCDVEYSQGAHLQLLRSKGDNDSNLIQYIFFQKAQYLDYKTVLESKGKLQDSRTDNNALTSQYIYNDRLVMLITKTIKSMTVYIINISNEKLN